MKVIVFGATGLTGIEIVKQLLEAGHHVTAVARTPSKLKIQHQNLAIHQGDVLQLDTFQSALEGHDIVISALGAKPSRKPIYLYSEGAKNILQAMAQYQIKRIVCVTAAALKKGDPNLPFYLKYIIQPLFLQRIHDDMIRMEKIVEASRANYTFVRPPRLVDAPITGEYRAEEGHSLPKGKSISRSDVAHYIVKHLQDSSIIKKGVAVAY